MRSFRMQRHESAIIMIELNTRPYPAINRLTT